MKRINRILALVVLGLMAGCLERRSTVIKAHEHEGRVKSGPIRCADRSPAIDARKDSQVENLLLPTKKQYGGSRSKSKTWNKPLLRDRRVRHRLTDYGIAELKERRAKTREVRGQRSEVRDQ